MLMRLTSWIYYRRVIIEGLDNLPKNGAFILASNHPNSFLDAIVLGSFLPRSLHFIARSDVFNTPMKRWILGQLQMIPIYRLQEGIENLDKNKDTFKRCHEVLRGGGVINIYAEGICVQEKRLRKLKKGTARIALDYVEEFNETLPVVGIGLNYMQPRQFRKELIIGISEPFDAKEITPTFKENPALAVKSFNDLLTRRLRTQVIHIEDKQRENEIDHALLTYRKTLGHTNNFFQKDTGVLSKLIAFANAINEGERHVSTQEVSRSNQAKSSWLWSTVTLFPAMLLAGLPIMAAKRLTKSKVRLNEFKDSVLVAAGMLFTLIYCLVLMIALGATFSWKAAVTFLALLISSVWLGLKGYDVINRNQ